MIVLGVQWYCMALYDFRLYLHRYVMHCSDNVLPTSEEEIEDCPLDVYGEPIMHAMTGDVGVITMKREKPVRQDLTLYHAVEAARVQAQANTIADVYGRVDEVAEEDSVHHPDEVHQNDIPAPKVQYDPFTLTPGHAAMPMLAPIVPPSSHLSSLKATSSFVSFDGTTSTHNTAHLTNAQDCCALAPAHVRQVSQSKQQDVNTSGRTLFDLFVPDELCGSHREEHCVLHVDEKPVCMAVYAFDAHVTELASICREHEVAKGLQYDHAAVDAAEIVKELCPGC